jgi:CheY-like chemotaxis protein
VGSPRTVRPVRSRSPRIIIIEDELLIALVIEEMAKDLGYRISGIASNLALARQELAKRNFDGALLDVNLNGRPCPELADLLSERGVPFGFLTGYDYIVEPRHENVPILQKPFTPAQLGVLLVNLVGPSKSTRASAPTASAS